MRLVTLALVALVVLLQHPLWFGPGGWLRVHELHGQLELRRDENARLKARNLALAAEVRDLKQGYEAIEERARSELGMVREDELFFQVIERPPARPPAAR